MERRRLMRRDSQYYGQVHVGTPSVSYNVIIDTGSSDFLLATSPCEAGCEPVTPIYHPSLSSSSVASSQDFQVTYGTGAARGVLVADTVSFGGFTLEEQTFAACYNLSGILQDDISGLLGLGWQPLATSHALPFVQALWEKGSLEHPVFGFAFARWNGNSTALDHPMPGGLLTIGDVDHHLFEGELNWLPSSQSYWQVELQSMSVMGTVLDISAEQVTIDTTKVLISFTFGNITYPMNTRDFNNGATTSSGPGNERCIGAVFVLSDMHGKGRWIFGDAFLKNVYSAFRFDPPP
ncbi:aspartic peptidase domain-containing protein [Leucosporidium creatinivorum]|uniref:Aspartic peptidase domain-containing protein n=1 Tax=Leucosporidium creatinivorum TaxID=106004 RepID=A0A1Y2ETY6_9BASI|nr:aspartic peptidase domain-containing protein [Leucosporidium creatinivorum]